MSESTGSVGCGGGIASVLTVLFVALKLLAKQIPTPVADWSWFWVFSPLIFSAILSIILIIVVGVLMGVSEATNGRRKW